MTFERAPLLLVLLISLITTACQNRTPRAERAKPQVAITSDAVFIRRAPAAEVRIAVDAVEGQARQMVQLHIDDLPLPLQAHQQRAVDAAFVQWQRLRQHLIDSGQLTAATRSVRADLPTELVSAQEQLLQEIPEVAPYRQSFGNIQATWH